MRLVVYVLSLMFGLGLAAAAQALPTQTSESHAEHAAGAAVPVPAQRYSPDAPLREGIRRAHAAIEALHQDEMGHLSAVKTVELATEVEAAVTYMFANCKLTSEPDAALHGILVPLLTAAQTLKSDPKNVKVVAEMRAAITRYPKYFDDPGWDMSTPPSR